MDADRVDSVGRAEPQVISAHGADLGHVEERGDAGVQRADRADGLDGMGSRQQVFRLDLVARARREVSVEVGQALMPRAGLAELGIAVHGIELLERVQRCLACGDTEGRSAGPYALAIDAALEPQLCIGLGAPTREDAHRGGGAKDRVEVVLDDIEIEAREDRLRDVVGRLYLKLHARDDAECAERHHPAGEVGIDTPPHPLGPTIRRDDLDSGHRARQRADGIA